MQEEFWKEGVNLGLEISVNGVAIIVLILILSVGFTANTLFLFFAGLFFLLALIVTFVGLILAIIGVLVRAFKAPKNAENANLIEELHKIDIRGVLDNVLEDTSNEEIKEKVSELKEALSTLKESYSLPSKKHK